MAAEVQPFSRIKERKSLNCIDTGYLVENIPVQIFTISGEEGITAKITNAGASVLSLCLPDNDGGSTDIILGDADPISRLLPGPMFGVTLGRCAGRIRNAGYEYGGRLVRLSPNKKGHNCHGGFRGFDKHMFEVAEAGESYLALLYESPDGEEGFPGKLTLKVTFCIEKRNFKISYEAVTDRDCPVSLSNHLYINLSGHGSGEITGHEMQLNADCLEHQDEQRVADGELLDVADTVFDFRKLKSMMPPYPVSHPQWKLNDEYDHTYLLRKERKEAAIVKDSKSGRTLKLYTDLPAVHFYVCDFSREECIGKDGIRYDGRCSFCLEPMYPQNAVNLPNLPSPILHKGEVYNSTTVFAFDW